MQFLWVTPENSVIERTQNYKCEKKFYVYECLRPQKAALKAYNSICFHNKNFKDLKNYYFFNPQDFLEFPIQPNCTLELNEQNLLEDYKTKLFALEKKPKDLEIFVRNIKTNKLHGYIIKTLLNFTPNKHELKNKIIIKLKAFRLFYPNTAMKFQDYKPYL